MLRAVLVKLFADRQLSVEPHLVDYVLVRMERSMLAAERFVAEADRRALVLQHRVTRAMPLRRSTPSDIESAYNLPIAHPFVIGV